MVAEQTLRMVFGAAPVPFSIPPNCGQVFIGEFIYLRYRLLIRVALVVGLWLLLTRTAFGRVVRAGVQNWTCRRHSAFR